MSSKQSLSWIYWISTSWQISSPSKLIPSWLPGLKLIGRCDPDVQGILSRMTYKDFLTTPEGRKVSRQLVTNLIEQQIGQEHGVSSMCLGVQVKLIFRSIRLARHYSENVEHSVSLGTLSSTRSADNRPPRN